MMSKKYLLPAAVFLSFFVAILGFGLCFTTFVDTLQHTDVISSDYRGSISTLVGFLQGSTEKNYYIDLQGRCDPHGLALISMHYAPDSVYINNTKIEFAMHTSISERILVAEIPSESLVYSEEGLWSMRIDLHGQADLRLSYMSICSMETAKTLISIYNIMLPMTYGILFTISLYGFLLYLSKRDRMLLLFSLYTLCVFIWCFAPCLINNFDAKEALLKPIATYAFDFAVVLGMATCISFCEVKLSGRWQIFGEWRGLLALCIVFSLVYNHLTSDASAMFLFVTYMAGSVILIIACGKSERKPWVALCGLSITQALRFIALNYSSTAHSLSFYFEMMKSMRLLTLPYIVGCMIYINSTFATKFKETENLARKLEQANELLDRKVEERTSALLEQQQIKTNLMTNIFHDLRSPLLILHGCTDKIKNGRYYDEETVRILDDRLSFITDLTEELFATIKLEDKSLIMETEPIHLNPMLQKIVDAYQMEANKKGVGIAYSADTNAIAWGDESWLSRAFHNLISNAIYYSKPEGKDVVVTMQTVSGQILVCITDHGVGIAPEDQDKIFDRYYRTSGTKKHKSSGLGLSIAASVIAHHNGSITVESKVGEGTTFFVTLPLWSISPA